MWGRKNATILPHLLFLRYIRKTGKSIPWGYSFTRLKFMLSLSTHSRGHVSQPFMPLSASIIDSKCFSCPFQFSIKTITLGMISLCPFLDIMGCNVCCLVCRNDAQPSKLVQYFLFSFFHNPLRFVSTIG